MSSAGGRVRSRRSAESAAVPPPARTKPGGAKRRLRGRRVRVAITSAQTSLAAALAPYDFDVVGLDEVALDDPTLAVHLAGVDVLVHSVVLIDLGRELAELKSAGPGRRDRSVREIRTLLLAAAATGVGHVVVVSSGMVYGARADNPVPLPADAPLRADGTTGLIADLVAMEKALAQGAATYPQVRLSVLRPATLVGGTDTIMTRHVAAPRLLRLKDTSPGAGPRWQFCHLEDLASAIGTVIDAGLTGVIPVGPEDSLSELEFEEAVQAENGMPVVELTESAATGLAHRLHRVGSLPSPATDLAYIAYPWVVSAERLRTAGWQPAFSSRACVPVIVDDARAHRHRQGRKLDVLDGAAIGAASAAVAAGATAAIMRRRRKKG